MKLLKPSLFIKEALDFLWDTTHLFFFDMKRVPGTLEDALRESVYFVEADSFSRHALWVMYVHRPDPLVPFKVDWSGNGMQGYGVSLDGGTHLMCWFDFIFGKLVCFYEPTSAKVDWDEVETFLEPYYARDGARRRCNASNFQHCISFLRS